MEKSGFESVNRITLVFFYIIKCIGLEPKFIASEHVISFHMWLTFFKYVHIGKGDISMRLSMWFVFGVWILNNFTLNVKIEENAMHFCNFILFYFRTGKTLYKQQQQQQKN